MLDGFANHTGHPAIPETQRLARFVQQEGDNQLPIDLNPDRERQRLGVIHRHVADFESFWCLHQEPDVILAPDHATVLVDQCHDNGIDRVFVAGKQPNRLWVKLPVVIPPLP